MSLRLRWLARVPRARARRRALLAGALGLIALLEIGGCAESERVVAPHSGGPNLVLLIADDLGFGDLGHRGGPIETPNLDRLSREGVELQRFYVSPLCTPTRAALFTGRSPIRFGLQYQVLLGWSRTGLPASEPTLAERLRDTGYATAMVGKWHLGHARHEFHPNAHGFEHFYGHLLGSSYFDHRYEGGKDLQRDGMSVRDEGYETVLLGDELVRVIEARDPARPLFLVGSFCAPHTPLEAPEELEAAYQKKLGLANGDDLSTYAAMLDILDRQIGRVLEALERAGIASNTLVVFLSDNGAPDGPGSNAPLRGHKGSVNEGGIRVPAVLRWPAGLGGPRKSDQLARDFDLAPTLLAAAGVDAGAESDRHAAPAMDGIDLLPALREGRTLPRTPFFFAVDGRQRITWYAVVDGSRKLVVREKRDGSEPREIALYDLETDPHEERNLAQSQPERVEPLLAALDSWRALHPADGLRLQSRPPRGWKAPADWSRSAQTWR